MIATAVRENATQNVVPNACASSVATWSGPRAAAASACWMPPFRLGSLLVIACCRTTASSAAPIQPATRWTTLIALVALPIAGPCRPW